jgi:membrane-bound serine protease (ClpP class)
MNRRIRGFWRFAGLFFLGLGLLLPGLAAHGQDSVPVVGVLNVTGPVAPAMQLYIERGVQLAQDRGFALLVFQLNTPGGSIGTLNSIITTIRGSTIPIAVYISPRGAWAASAGTLITLAGHVSAMAPETTIGAASPVGSQGQDIPTTEETKVKEVLKATVRELAKDRSPQAVQLGQDMIDNARAVTSTEAINAGLVDLQANTVQDLVVELNGHEVKVLGQEKTLQLTGAQLQDIPQSLIEEALKFLTDPNLVFVFLSAGIWAIIIEVSSPGGWVAGFTGAVLLLLATFGLGILPVNWFGLLFLALAFLLFILDIKMPTHGALTLAGTVSFIAGSLVLFNSVRVPGVPTISIPLVVGTGLFIASTFFAALTVALRAQAAPVITSQMMVIGQIGIVRQTVDPRGHVQVAGELWSARLVEGEAPLQIGERAEVVAVEGIQIKVKKAQ